MDQLKTSRQYEKDLSSFEIGDSVEAKYGGTFYDAVVVSKITPG